MSVKKITERKDYIPGALYVTMTESDDGFDRDGAFVYWTGGQFVTEDGDDADQIDWDYLVQQTGPGINPDMVEDGFMDTTEADPAMEDSVEHPLR